MFGLDSPQINAAAKISKILGEEWRGLVAGVDGFIADGPMSMSWEDKVVWGEMVRGGTHLLCASN